jgi:predicted dehydrogenase
MTMPSRTRSSSSLSRRSFVTGAGALGGALAWPRGVAAQQENPGPPVGPNDIVTLAVVGIGGRGLDNIKDVKDTGVKIVALCEVDDRQAAEAWKMFPEAKRYKDWRRMLDAEKTVDAVLVATPDHNHGIVSIAAMRRGKHVYCEKPLAHSVGEVRAIMKAAREHRVVTQLGNQGHSSGDIRRLVEWVRAGVIGKVHTIHAACDAVHCRIGDLGRRGEKHEVPGDLDWDLWLGPAAWREYHPMYLPGSWRAWKPFGNGTIGDWVCHVVDPSFWALDLGLPRTVEVVKQLDYDPKEHADTFARGDVIKFEFPARGERGPVTLFWYSGVERIPRPEGMEPDKQPPGTGAVLIGDRGVIQHGSHGAGGVRLVPEAKMKEFKEPPQSIPRVKDHYQDFLSAVREGRKAGSDIPDYGGPLTEIAMLGIIAMNFPGRKLTWDAEAMRFPDAPEANAFIDPPARAGWGTVARI